MPTATLYLADVGGFAGPSRCYALDPPKDFGELTAHYATVTIVPAYGIQPAEVVVVAATESGACATSSVIRQPGSFVCDGDPDSPEYVDGCHVWALSTLGGYEIVIPPGEGGGE